MRKADIVLVLVLALAACVSDNGALGANLDRYTGRRANDLFAVLGPPSAETAVANEEVYVWGDARLAALPTMQTSGGAANARDMQCTIRVFVAPDERIRSWDILGNETACQSYTQRFAAH